jgi:hypothetical protein
VTDTEHPWRSFSKDVQNTLADPLPEPQVLDFYNRLYDRLSDLSDTLRRSTLGLLIVAAITELFNGTGVAHLQLGPFEINDLSTIRKFLPLLGAYLIYDLVATGTRYVYSRRVLNALNYAYRPALFRRRYAALTYPLTGSLYGRALWSDAESNGSHLASRLVGIYTTVLRLGSATTPVALECIWFWRLFLNYGTGDALVWLSLVLSVGFVSFAAATLVNAVGGRMVDLRKVFDGLRRSNIR